MLITAAPLETWTGLFSFLIGKASNGGCNSWPAPNPPLWPSSWRQHRPGTSCLWAILRIRMAPSCFAHASLWYTVCPSDADELKRRTGNRTLRKDSQGLPHIVEQLSTPLIHLIRFSQLTFPPFHEYMGFKFATACPSWHSEPGASPSISAKRGKKKIKPSQNTYCWSALI